MVFKNKSSGRSRPQNAQRASVAGVPKGSRAGGRPGKASEPGRAKRAPHDRLTATARPQRVPRVRASAPAVTESPASQPTETKGDIVYGRHPSLAALEGEQAINKIWMLKGIRNQELVTNVRTLAKAKGATLQLVERAKLDALTLNANHQGIVVSLASAVYHDVDELIERALASRYPALLMLDGIEDPHNLGALIRTAEAASFQGVIIPNRRAVGLTPVAAKSAAGAVGRVPVARVGNLAQCADKLRKAGFWLVGADVSDATLPYDTDLTRPLVLVIGSEGFGLAHLLRQKCDATVKLPLGGQMESLNASVAGGILMYEAVRQRGQQQPTSD